uniref:Putative secreted peptide n=1 Tax=Anopheles braziliensis TaxID=58242 RepID=A0A2M3ZRI0_9DIPT
MQQVRLVYCPVFLLGRLFALVPVPFTHTILVCPSMYRADFYLDRIICYPGMLMFDSSMHNHGLLHTKRSAFARKQIYIPLSHLNGITHLRSRFLSVSNTNVFADIVSS